MTSAKGEHMTTVGAPSGREVREGFEAMWDAMVQLGFVWILSRVGRDALDKHLLSAPLVARKVTI